MEPPVDWPFPDDSPNVAVITTQAVLDGEWIALATIDEEDDGWQFHSRREPVEEDARVVALKRIYSLDPSIAELADLPLGGRAWCESPDAPWQRSDKN